jgi:hypothetical protein
MIDLKLQWSPPPNTPYPTLGAFVRYSGLNKRLTEMNSNLTPPIISFD